MTTLGNDEASSLRLQMSLKWLVVFAWMLYVFNGAFELSKCAGKHNILCDVKQLIKQAPTGSARGIVVDDIANQYIRISAHRTEVERRMRSNVFSVHYSIKPTASKGGLDTSLYGSYTKKLDSGFFWHQSLWIGVSFNNGFVMEARGGVEYIGLGF